MKLFTPGPVGLKQEVLDYEVKNIFHRAKGYQQLHSSIVNQLKVVFDSDESYEELLIVGSGTLANETAIHSLINKDDRVLLLSNGDFGDRLEKILKLNELEFTTLRKLHGEIFSMDEVQKMINTYNPTVLMMVALETSTGIWNHVNEVGNLLKDKDIRFFVDAVSALGAQEISMVKDHIDVCTSVSNKALESFPGISFVSVKKDYLEETKGNPKRSLYLDIHKYYDFALKSQTPTTPPTGVLQTLEYALKVMLEETIENRIKRYKENSTLVRDELEKLDLEVVNLRHGDEFAANAISCFKLPNNINPKDLHEYLFGKGYTLWFYHDRTEEYLKDLIQISVMGDISKTDIHGLFELIKEFLNGKK